MERKNLKSAGIQVSDVCMGTMTFGGQTGEEDAKKMVNLALEAGVNFFDTADSYTEGRSEEILGRALGKKRQDVILASKVFWKKAGVLKGGLSRSYILSSLEGSLKRLGTDYLDIYYCHFPDTDTPLEETMDTMADLVHAGKVRYVGVSNFASWQVQKMVNLAEKRGGFAPVISENVDNLLTRTVEGEMRDCLEDLKMDMVVYNPLAGGLLTGKHGSQGPKEGTRLEKNPRYYSRYWNEANLNAVETLEKIAKKAGMSLPELALRWCKSQEYITSTILGASKVEHLQENLAAMEKGVLSGELQEEVEQVWKQLPVGNRYRYNR